MLSLDTVHGSPRRLQLLYVAGDRQVAIEDGVTIGVYFSPSLFSGYSYLKARQPSSSVRIGTGTWINNNFSAIADYSSIEIGKNCSIGSEVDIVGSDFHGLRVSERMTPGLGQSAPVVVGDDVFIGSNVKITKGVRVGRGSVVANGSIVVKDVPAGTIVGGNLARVIRAVE